MILNNAVKQKITDALKADFESKKATYKSQAKYGTSIGIHSSTITNVLKENWKIGQQLLSNDKWIEVAHAINYNLLSEQKWYTAKTKTVVEIWEKIDFARAHYESIVICDKYGIGKTEAIESYNVEHDFTYLIDDTREIGTKSLFIKELARVTGAGMHGTMIEKAQRAVSIIKSQAVHKPVLIIDEAGDMNNTTIEWLKKLINQTKGCMALVLVGSDGLRSKIERGEKRGANGFGELFSRLGERYLEYLPKEPNAATKYMKRQTVLVCRANGVTEKSVIAKIIEIGGDMRRVKREILKHKKEVLVP